MDRQSAKNKKRSNILGAAARIFSKEGYYEARVEDIAQLAGVGKGTIYLYFQSKRDLFYCMIKEGTDLFLSDLAKKLEGERDYERILKTLIEFTFEFMEKRKEITTLIISNPGMVDEDMQLWLSHQKNKVIKYISSVVEEYTRINRLGDVNPTIAAHALYGIIISVLGDRLFQRKDFELNKTIDEMLDMFFYGLKNCPSTEDKDRETTCFNDEGI